MSAASEKHAMGTFVGTGVAFSTTIQDGYKKISITNDDNSTGDILVTAQSASIGSKAADSAFAIKAGKSFTFGTAHTDMQPLTITIPVGATAYIIGCNYQGGNN